MYNYPTPNTYRPEDNRDPRMQRPQIFDPALWHFSQRAFRLGDPAFQDPEIARRWFEARQQAIEYLLLSIQGSSWHEHLVLRGSVLLKAFLSDRAREPNDIDWVFRPTNITREDRQAKQLMHELIQLLKNYPEVGDIKIDGDRIATDDLWNYARSHGKRILIPWQAEGLPRGTLQVDIVFGERLFDEPILTPIPTMWGESISLWAASKELSLAWKIRWLESDRYPQGKDLYDATLLAEQTNLPFELLRTVVEDGDGWKMETRYIRGFSWQSGFPWDMELESIEWADFMLEYPWVEGDAQSWVDRLSRALAPTFVGRDDG
jgi:hypothetical protein